MDKINSGPEYLVNGSGLQYFYLRKYHFQKAFQWLKSQPKWKSANRVRSSRKVEERCYSSWTDNTSGVFEQYIFSFKERWGKLAGSEYEIFEHFHILPKFQNGGSTSHKGSFPIKRLYDKSRLKRCLF